MAGQSESEFGAKATAVIYLTQPIRIDQRIPPEILNKTKGA